MKFTTTFIIIIQIVGSLFLLTNCGQSGNADWRWETIVTNGEPTARHEAGLAAYNDKIYLIGGRRINPTSIYDIKANKWSDTSPTPMEIHHFQPVTISNAIYMVGAMTGGWPTEKPLEQVLVYYPDSDEYKYTHTIPEHRRRGGAGAVLHNGKIYLIGGITNGHMDGYKPWFDEYDPKTGEWKTLPDAPIARDHFQAVVIGDKLYAFAGRNTSRRTNQDMKLTIEHGNVFDFKTGKWEAVTNDLALPTLRAGNSAFVWQDEIIIGGGESTAHLVAHSEVEAYNVNSRSWRKWPSLNEGRHGTGLVVVGDHVYTASGCGNRGGEPELTTIEKLKLPTEKYLAPNVVSDKTLIYAQWHTVTKSFEGPETSENASINPFLDYRLIVEFTHAEAKYTVRGYYAADGYAAESSAKSGNKWHVKFTPDKVGEWTYKAVLHEGTDIALDKDHTQGKQIELSDSSGKFIVTRSDKDGKDFRAHGRLVAVDGYFKFAGTDNYWMKAGTNSPENLLAIEDIDDTYRIKAKGKDGEAPPPLNLHKYAPHLQDWKTGDPTWQNGKGKGLIGAINYLASMGMNADYFLTLNILGDGKDVWPYVSPDDFSRFDVSKLAQWDIVFSHMQSKGILLHVVVQETENETMLDNGDTGRLRQLYFNELIARFGHHLALVWNLGEENGPAPWAPDGQNDAQRKAMASYLKANDPYGHPVLLHTHSYDPLREDILNDIVGYKDVDGLSLQANIRETASEVVTRWKKAAGETGHEWLITMDEIGEWHTAVLTDELDPDHNTIRQYAMWGTLLSGAAGVEWYFGAKYPHNDLSSEDWRQRNRLWELTAHAQQFFEQYLPYWEMKPEHGLINNPDAYCLRKEGEIYAIYLPDTKRYTIDLKNAEGDFTVEWYDPLEGGDLQLGAVKEIIGGKVVELGSPPKLATQKKNQDWVVLIRKKESSS